MKGITTFFSGSSPSEPLDKNQTEMIELVKLKIGSTQPKEEMKTELLSTEKALLKVLDQVKSDPEMLKRVLDGLDLNDPLSASAAKLLSQEITTSQIILSDEEKADEWFKQISGENIKLLDAKELHKELQQRKKEPWRYYHFVTVPAKGIYTAGKYGYQGYRVISNIVLPVAVCAMVIQSPWLPILRLILGKIL